MAAQVPPSGQQILVRGVRAAHEDPAAIYAQRQLELLKSLQWQSIKADAPARQRILGEINRLLLLKRPEGVGREWTDKIPGMAKRLEIALFRSSLSLNEYKDETTLKNKLHVIAQEMKGSNSASHSSVNLTELPPAPPVTTFPPEYPPRILQNASGGANLSNQQRSLPTSPQVYLPPPTPAMSFNSMIPSTPGPTSTNMHSQDVDLNPSSNSNSQQFSSQPSSTRPPTQTDVLRQQQQRLLLLRHASKCPTPPGELCAATGHCSAMKVLWKHIADCKDPQCYTAHCVSSRFVLAHYHKCVDVNCGVCEPVRLAIRKNNDSKVASAHPVNSVEALRQKYIALWRLISKNAQIAREKQHKCEGAVMDCKNRQRELKEAKEEEYNHYQVADIYRDENWEKKSKVLQLLTQAKEQAARSADLTRCALETEVQQMREQHDKNVEAEKQLQHEFSNFFPGESCKAEIMSARGEAQNGLNMQPQIAPATPRASSIPVARVDAQQVINQKISKKGMSAATSEPKVRKPRAPRVPASPKAGAVKKLAAQQPLQQQQSQVQAVVETALAKKSEHVVPVFRQCTTPRPIVFDTSLVSTFSRLDIQAHVHFLNECAKQEKPSKNKELCSMLLKKCSDADVECIFARPVSPIEDGAPNYLEIIKKPMDFSTIKERLDDVKYDLPKFLADMRLVFSNCILYNMPSTTYYAIGVKIGQLFKREYARLMEHEEDKANVFKYNPDYCCLCFKKERYFECISYFCAGCNKKIPKAGYIYSSQDNRYWCHVCVTSEPDEVTIEGVVVPKRSFKKIRFPEAAPEIFVACYSCKRWMHQVCGMYNHRKGQESSKDDFLCPSCVLQVLDERPKFAEGIKKKCTARDLPETKFSRYIEQHVFARAKEWDVNCHSESIDPSSFCVRIVMARECDVWTRPLMQKVYPDVAPIFNSKQRAILLFQKLDGVDVLLYIMFLQEYGSDCPMPNSRCVYLAYLDSINYMKPSLARTNIYHEMVSSAIAYEKERGFTRFFIWSCPPVGGDDYIFNVHPKSQKTPKSERLRFWYLQLLEQCRQRGIVISISNLYDEYFSRVSELKHVPYFEGDCWVSYMESFHKELEDKGVDPMALQGKKDLVDKALNRIQVYKNNAKSVNDGFPHGSNKRPVKRGRKKSAIEEEEDMLINQSSFACVLPKALDSVPMQSALTFKIASEMEKMRDDFLVAKFVYDCVSCGTPQDYPGAFYWLPKGYSPAQDIHPDFKKRRYAPPYCLCHECYKSMYFQEFSTHFEESDHSLPEFPPPEWKEEYDAYLKQQGGQKEEEKKKRRATPPPSPVIDSATVNVSVKRSIRKRKLPATEDSTEEDLEILEFGKTAVVPNPYATPPCSLSEFYPERAHIRPQTVDEDPLMECPIFFSREEFLEVCKGNKYQFDDLRRAKHSTMMILFHLHNPESEAFVRTCNNCQEEVSGNQRYVCASCPDFDCCLKCFPKNTHIHPLEKAVQPSVVPSSAATESSTTPLTPAETQEQLRKVAQQILDSFPHASTCQAGEECTISFCSKAKKLFEHLGTCRVQLKGGCTSCKRGWYLMSLHAQKCKVHTGCPVPHCDSLKARNRSQINETNDRRMKATMHRAQQQQQQQSVGEDAGTVNSPVIGGNGGMPSSVASPEDIAREEPSPPPLLAAPMRISQRGGNLGGKGGRVSESS